MEIIEILIIIGSVGIVIGTIVAAIIRKKKGKTACCGDCSSCPLNDKHNKK